MGYLKRGSSTSMIVSSASATLLLIAASLMPAYRIGTLLALGAFAHTAGRPLCHADGRVPDLFPPGPQSMRPRPSTWASRPACLARVGTSLTLAGWLGLRAYKSGKALSPPGAFAIVSAAMSAGYVRTLVC